MLDLLYILYRTKKNFIKILHCIEISICIFRHTRVELKRINSLNGMINKVKEKIVVNRSIAIKTKTKKIVFK